MNETVIRDIELRRQWRRADADVRRIVAESVNDIGAPSPEVLGQRCERHAVAFRKRASILKRLGHQPVPSWSGREQDAA